MKPGMQRDILVAFWLLFDEFEIANSDCPPPDRTVPNPPSQIVAMSFCEPRSCIGRLSS